MARIDGKYDELRELSQSGAETLLEVRDPNGNLLRLGWFDVSTPAARASFHRYRASLKALAPAGLLDVVARPGAYYSLWRPLEGTPLPEYLESPSRDPEAIQALRELAGRLAAQGYALADAEVVVHGEQPLLARLAPAERTEQEVSALNAPVLSRLNGGRVRRKGPARTRRAGVLGFLPGLLFLGGAAYLTLESAQEYLNPDRFPVPNVVGQRANDAAAALEQVLSPDGTEGYFQVAFKESEDAEKPIGTVLVQDIPPDTRLPAGRVVTLTVNNPRSLTVPRLEDLTLNQARSRLAESRLRVGQVLTVDGGVSGTPEGHVIAQVPEPGATTVRGQSVSLLVSSGIRPAQTWLPDLSGLAYEAARDLVRQAGLSVTSIRTRTADAPENTVLDQRPAPYQKVDVGSEVTLTVARAASATPADAIPELPLAPDPVPEPQREPVVPDPVPRELPAAPADEAPAAQEEDPAESGGVEADEQSRTVQISYLFPQELPDGQVEIVVRDLDGERSVLPAQPSSAVAGNRAEGPVTVRGPATFTVRVNGRTFATFER